MGIRIISPDGQQVEVLKFKPNAANRIWCWCNMRTQQHNLVYGKKPLFIKKGSEPHFVIELSPAFFQSFPFADSKALQIFLKSRKRGRALFSDKPLDLDYPMQQCLASIVNYQGAEETKRIFLYARAVDLLWLQQENYLRTQTSAAKYVKTEYDRERIIFARDYLLTHMDAPPTLIQLSAIAGINEFKLKRGFKEMFNQSVFAYLAEVRLEMARRALLEKKKTVTRIAFELGYASLQHFSKAFKDKFGKPPAKYS
jgi:AraC-like DNA-binding protein